ncbi:MAG: universal stress protein A [Methylobacter sp.]|nr:MAG: universal stress protein A [Methylobacter sp.]
MRPVPSGFSRYPLNGWWKSECALSCEYRHILLAVDQLHADSEIAFRAKRLAAQNSPCKLSLLHVLDDVAMPDTPYGSRVSLDEESDNVLLERQKGEFTALAHALRIPMQDSWLVWGLPSDEIIMTAKRLQVDLIVLGSHGRHGLSLLLGATASRVMHQAECDVLAVRLQNN